MNKYGKLAHDHWTRADPQRVTQIENPSQFFSNLGEQVENQIIDLQNQIAGADKPGETYLQKVGRLNMARLQAEEIVLHEMVWLQTSDPEDEGALPSEDGISRRREQEEEQAEYEAEMQQIAAEMEAHRNSRQ